MGLDEFFEQGGLLMWPILACSVIAAVAFVERMLALTRSRVLPPTLYQSVHNHLSAADFGRAEQLCREDRSTLGRIVMAGLMRRPLGRDAVKEAMQETGAVEVAKLDRWLAVLSTVAAIAPLLGLLGTVTGMIEVFNDIEEVANPNVSLLANGIKQALYTTAAGLTVAIPVFVASRFLESRIERFAGELEERSLVLLDLMAPERPAKPTPEAAA